MFGAKTKQIYFSPKNFSVMELDKNTIKALSADTRVEILKSLKSRRKMPSELSKELGLATSTITEHLKNLENVGLIQKKDTDHKWIYYELTGKGSNIVQPKYPVNILLTLGIGLILIVGGTSFYFSGYEQASIAGIEQKEIAVPQDAGAFQKTSQAEVREVVTAPTENKKVVNEIQQRTRIVIFTITAIAGFVLIIYGVYRFRTRKGFKVV